MPTLLMSKCKLFIFIFSLILISSCYKSSTPNKTAGFVGDYSLLKPLNNDIKTLFYQNKNATKEQYHSIIIHPVTIFFLEDSKNKHLKQEDLTKLGEYFKREMTEVVKNKFKIVDKPGPGVLRLRTALIDIRATDVVANIISKTLFYLPVDMGEAAMEGEIRDSETGELLAAIVDRKIGTLFSPSLGYTKWGHVKDAFEDWADQLDHVIERKYQPPK